jgi:hypothetical protein
MADDDELERWREQRSHAVTAHAAALQRRKAAETAQARELIADFTREADERGLRLRGLTARAYDGRAKYRTALRGWYINTECSLAIGSDGRFYILNVPTSWQARLTGAIVAPQDPPLVVGEGGRDGSSIPLAALLRRRLDAGDNWP